MVEELDNGSVSSCMFHGVQIPPFARAKYEKGIVTIIERDGKEQEVTVKKDFKKKKSEKLSEDD